MPRPLLLLLPLLALLLAGDASANQLLDQDLDGAPDFASVGDWDGDGPLELADIRAALAALTDCGAKTVFVEPGVFLPGAAPAGVHGLVELPSQTTLRCAGPALTTLRGLAASVTDLDLSPLGLGCGGWPGVDERGFASSPSVCILLLVLWIQSTEQTTAAGVGKIDMGQIPGGQSHADPFEVAIAGRKLKADALDAEGAIALALCA